jgi:hypothetical protein
VSSWCNCFHLMFSTSISSLSWLSNTRIRHSLHFAGIQCGLASIKQRPGLCWNSLICRRHNRIDWAGWQVVMNGLESVTSVTTFNSVDDLGGLFAGGQTKAELGCKCFPEHEALDVVLRLLARSRITLKSLNLRWAEINLWGKRFYNLATYFYQQKRT